MKSIREKLESDETIIFEAKPSYSSIVFAAIVLAMIFIVHLDLFLVIFLALYAFAIFKSYFISKFIVTNKRILTISSSTCFISKEILLEDIKCIKLLKIPLWGYCAIAIYRVNVKSIVPPYFFFNMAAPNKLGNDLLLYIKSIENNSLNQESIVKMNYLESIATMFLGYLYEIFSIQENYVNKIMKRKNKINDREIPEEIKSWSWGAFFLNWLWGIFNGSYWALLALIPYFGCVWAYYCGVKGNEWAWKNKQWKSIEQFQTVQKKWALYGAIF